MPPSKIDPVVPPFPKGKTITALIDEVGALAARNDVLRVMYAEIKEERDKHERFIVNQYETLYRLFGRLEGKLDGLVKVINERTIAIATHERGGRHGDAARKRKVGTKSKKKHGAKRDRGKPAPGAGGAGG